MAPFFLYYLEYSGVIFLRLTSAQRHLRSLAKKSRNSKNYKVYMKRKRRRKRTKSKMNKINELLWINVLKNHKQSLALKFFFILTEVDSVQNEIKSFEWLIIPLEIFDLLPSNLTVFRLVDSRLSIWYRWIGPNVYKSRNESKTLTSSTTRIKMNWILLSRET